ncbi:MAG: metal ABC transporter ATP-binding protein [Smithellaceae bacterium]|nr:metal ABC transporter ATP-binding protein [Smithellaceae bacterium]
MSLMDVLTVRNLNFRYNTAEILKNISFSVGAGDYVALVGPNGSGKTTLIKIILGLLAPYGGTVDIFGHGREYFPHWDKIGYLPQKVAHPNQLFPASVREVVAMGLISRKRFPRYLRRNDEEKIGAALGLLDITDLARIPFAELSLGQQQRVLVARAIVNKPDFLIMDEPTSALDPENRERFFALIQDLNRGGATIIIVTHDLGNIGRYSSKLLYIDKRLIFYGSFEEFCHSKDVTQLFGEYAQHIICHRHDAC